MNKIKAIVVAIIGGVSLFTNFLLLGFNFYVSIFPDDARKMFGDKILNRFMELPLPIIVGVLIVVFICCIGFSLWTSGVFDKKSLPVSQGSDMPFKANKGGVAVKENTGTISVTNNFGDVSKKKVKSFDVNALDFEYHRRWRHSRFSVYDAKLSSLLDYIKNGISTLFLYYQESDFVSYETDLGNTKYWNPNIDNVIYHGVVFRGIKKLFEMNSEGKKVKKEEIKLDILFTIYVEQIKTPDKKSMIDIVMDGDGLYTEYFFVEFQKYVGKRFRASPIKRDE